MLSREVLKPLFLLLSPAYNSLYTDFPQKLLCYLVYSHSIYQHCAPQRNINLGITDNVTGIIPCSQVFTQSNVLFITLVPSWVIFSWKWSLVYVLQCFNLTVFIVFHRHAVVSTFWFRTTSSLSLVEEREERAILWNEWETGFIPARTFCKPVVYWNNSLKSVVPVWFAQLLKRYPCLTMLSQRQ